MDRASAAYERVGLRTAEDKGLRGAEEGTAVGAEILGSWGTVGAPRQRRVALSVLSLRQASLPVA
eukprot:9208138-Lingulodinium_polyedra.AAC.1